ncbi:hypothetical protein U1Q18_037707, partial [Sarracenia purpurea var. burkii]
KGKEKRGDATHVLSLFYYIMPPSRLHFRRQRLQMVKDGGGRRSMNKKEGEIEQRFCICRNGECRNRRW